MGLFDFLLKGKKDNNAERIENKSPEVKNDNNFGLFVQPKTIRKPLSSINDMEDNNYEVLKRVHHHNLKYTLSGIIGSYDNDLASAVKEFIDLGLIKTSIPTEFISSMKMTELKSILKSNNLKQAGSKDDLINRIVENLTEYKIREAINDEKCYLLTDLGADLLGTYKNLQHEKKANLESECFKLIMGNDYKQACKKVSEWGESQPVPAMGVENFRNEIIQLRDYNLNLPSELVPYEDKIRSLGILSNMLSKIDTPLDKLAELPIELKGDSYNLPDAVRYFRHLLWSQRDLNGYKRNNNEKYRFSATLDDITCPTCGKLDGKLMLVENAKIGTNFPPICSKCRCTTLEHFPDDKYGKDDKRIARDPKTGKNYYVPAKITYTQWRKTLEP